MPKDAISSSPQKSAQEEIQAAKPLPQPNLSATRSSEVYTIETLVPNGIVTLRQLPIRDWQDAISASEPVLTTSRFVSHRVEAVARSKNTTHLQLLRFILILLEFSRCLKPARSSAGKAGQALKRLPPREELRCILSGSSPSSHGQSKPTATSPLSDSFLDSIRRKFVPHSPFLSKHDLTLLHTTICALTLHIPSPSSSTFSTSSELATDPADIRDDLHLSNNDVVHYFRELGCRVDKPKENEFVKWGIEGGKVEAATRRIVRLKLPLVFPRFSRGSKR
jgi:DNA-directed RNA polymerase I subunit RPA49